MKIGFSYHWNIHWFPQYWGMLEFTFELLNLDQNVVEGYAKIPAPTEEAALAVLVPFVERRARPRLYCTSRELEVNVPVVVLP